ncbi:MAG: hypothetical protein Q4E69_05595 [Bacilli bacterium]|nr:hypothetical protein [Bacilli bacterium]
MKKKVLVIVTLILLVISCSTCLFMGYKLITDKRWDKEHELFLKNLDENSNAEKEVKDKKEELEKIKEENKEKVEVLESWKNQTQQVKQG